MTSGVIRVNRSDVLRRVERELDDQGFIDWREPVALGGSQLALLASEVWEILSDLVAEGALCRIETAKPLPPGTHRFARGAA